MIELGIPGGRRCLWEEVADHEEANAILANKDTNTQASAGNASLRRRRGETSRISRLLIPDESYERLEKVDTRCPIKMESQDGNLFVLVVWTGEVLRDGKFDKRRLTDHDFMKLHLEEAVSTEQEIR